LVRDLDDTNFIIGYVFWLQGISSLAISNEKRVMIVIDSRHLSKAQSWNFFVSITPAKNGGEFIVYLNKN
jgi:hypothetical protein